MYLRRVRFPDGDHHVIRMSFRVNGTWRHSDLMDLGLDPENFIEYTGGNGFYFDPAVEEGLQAGGADYSAEDLEQLFLPFLKPHIRRIIGSFQTHRVLKYPWGRHSHRELQEMQDRLHPFDKRRLHFLRCGRVDIGNLDGRPWKFLNILLEKSRDEIEHTIEGMESVLRPHEIRSYLFTAFHLQTCFSDHLLRNHPLGLDDEKVDECFLDALCCLNDDAQFFSGVDCHDAVCPHPYLSKYVILYFDSGFRRHGWPEDLEEFMRRKPFHRSAPSTSRMDIASACQMLGIRQEDLVNLHRKDLIRMYRKRAKELHPDRGGDKESFILMARAFEYLLERK